MPQCVAFAVLLLHKKQHSAAFILLLVAFYHLWKLRCSWRGIPQKILVHFTSCEGSVPSGEVFLEEFLLALPPTQSPPLLAMYSPTKSE